MSTDLIRRIRATYHAMTPRERVGLTLEELVARSN